MPLPFASFLPLIGQGISSLGNMIGGANINRQNRRFQQQQNLQNQQFQTQTNQTQMNFQREMYERTRQDALADWTRQTDYENPVAQMQRFKDAGLNPHLIYGDMQSSPTIRSAEATGTNIKAPEGVAPRVSGDHLARAFDLSPYFNIQEQQQRTDNLRVINTKIEADTARTRIATALDAVKILTEEGKASSAQTKAAIDRATKWLDEEFKSLRNQKIGVDIDYTDHSNTRADEIFKEQLKNERKKGQLMDAQVRESAERALTIASERGLIPLKADQLQKLIKSEEYKQRLMEIETKIRQAGGNPNAPLWQNIIWQSIKQLAEKSGGETTIY